MKLCLLCYVLPQDWQTNNNNNEFRYAHLFPDKHTKNTDKHSRESLDGWMVKPTSLYIRRVPVNGIKYTSIAQIHARSRKQSQDKVRRNAKKHPTNTNGNTNGNANGTNGNGGGNSGAYMNNRKAMKKRRDVHEIRAKQSVKITGNINGNTTGTSGSKGMNGIWEELLANDDDVHIV